MSSASAPDFRLAQRTLRRLLSQADIAQISMSGGEPMLMPRLYDLVWSARWSGAAVNILTNGTLMTDFEIGILKDLRVNRIQIPLLAAKGALHDSITGVEGSWQRSMEVACKVMKSREDWLTPVFILSRLNMEQIVPTLEMYGSMGAKLAMFNRFNIGGLGIRHARELTMSHSELRQAFATASRVAGDCNLTLVSGVCSPMCVLDPEEYPHITFTHCHTDIDNRPITVNYRGDVRFCNHSPRVLGNIYNQSIGEILNATKVDKIYGGVPDHCAQCTLWEMCRGGCRAASEQLYGTFDRVDPIVTDL